MEGRTRRDRTIVTDYWDPLTGTESRAGVRIGGAKCDGYKTLSKFMSAATNGGDAQPSAR